MATAPVRKLAAIMFTDMVGYSALMQKNEALGMDLLEEHRRLLRPILALHGGQEIKTIGDAFLVEFASSVQAVQCAVEMQRALAQQNFTAPAERQVQVRIGLHVGDVIYQENDVLGDGVNIASRIQPLAEPGGIALSGDVARQIHNKTGFQVEKVGPRQLKNIQEPVEIHRVVLPWAKGAPPPPPAALSPRSRNLKGVVAVIGVAIVLAGIGWWKLRSRSATPEPAAARPIQSLAVLPLENLSRDPEQEYFADGMTEALIADLGQIEALRVISRTSVMRFKGARPQGGLQEIARQLNVDAVIEGSVLRAGDRVRITAQLIDAKTDRHLWAQSYERGLREVLTLQSEVAQSIANEIKIKVTPQEQTRLASTRPVNPKAHEAYLKGQFFFNNLSRPNVLKAIEYAQQAVEIDPGYAPAYGLLASSYWESGMHAWGDLPDRESAEKTRAAAMKALALDDSLAEGHAGLGIVLDMHDWKWAGAEQELRRAIELNPNFARGHAMYAWHLLFVGRRDESIQEAKRAVELDPFSSHILMTLTAIHYFTRQYDQSLERARWWLEIFPHSPGPYRHMWYVYEATGMYDEAIAARKEAWTLEGRNAKDIAALGGAYQIGGIRAVWRWELENRKERGAEEGRFEVAAHTYALLGEKDKAFEWLEKGYERRDHGMVFIMTHYAYDNLRADPRYQDLLRRMNFPP